MPDLSLFQAGATLVPLSNRMLWDVGGQRFLWLGNPDATLPTATSRTESGGTGATLLARTPGQRRRWKHELAHAGAAADGWPIVTSTGSNRLGGHPPPSN